MSTEKSTTKGFTIVAEEDRPWVDQYPQSPSFRVGDSVYVLNSDGSRSGPYVVASVPSAQFCTLSTRDGGEVNNNRQIATGKLVAA